jgi:hypothetical protein
LAQGRLSSHPHTETTSKNIVKNDSTYRLKIKGYAHFLIIKIAQIIKKQAFQQRQPPAERQFFNKLGLFCK